MISVVYKPGFIRQFKKLPALLQKEVVVKVALFRDIKNHPALEVHKLHGRLNGKLGFSVNFKYRVVFIYLSDREAVLLAVGDHTVYE
ncbi:MAG: hypothetical protein Q8Q18_02300 [bacterium]|nr:hypothetical protein [bacterium]